MFYRIMNQDRNIIREKHMVNWFHVDCKVKNKVNQSAVLQKYHGMNTVVIQFYCINSPAHLQYSLVSKRASTFLMLSQTDRASEAVNARWYQEQTLFKPNSNPGVHLLLFICSKETISAVWAQRLSYRASAGQKQERWWVCVNLC